MSQAGNWRDIVGNFRGSVRGHWQHRSLGLKLGLLAIASTVLPIQPARAQNSNDCGNCEIIIPDDRVRVVDRSIFVKHEHGMTAINLPHNTRLTRTVIKSNRKLRISYVRGDMSGNIYVKFMGFCEIRINRALVVRDPNVEIQISKDEHLDFSDIMKFATQGSKYNRNLFGNSSGNEFDPNGFAHSIHSRGGGDTITYKRGYGHLTIDERSPDDSDDDNTLAFGAGISMENVRISQLHNRDIVLSLGHGDTIQIVDAVDRSRHPNRGVQVFEFADGTKWTIGDLRYAIHPTAGGLSIKKNRMNATVGAVNWTTNPPTAPLIPNQSQGPAEPPFSKWFDCDGLMQGGYLNESFEYTDKYSKYIDGRNYSIKIVNVTQSGMKANLDNLYLDSLLKIFISVYDLGTVYWSFQDEEAAKDFAYLKPGEHVTIKYRIALSDGKGAELHRDIEISVCKTAPARIAAYDMFGDGPCPS